LPLLKFQPSDLITHPLVIEGIVSSEMLVLQDAKSQTIAFVVDYVLSGTRILCAVGCVKAAHVLPFYRWW